MTKPAVILFFFFLSLCATGLAQDPEPTVKVDVKLVNVFVTVTDEHGAPVTKLKKENFDLREDNKEQKIAVFDKESAVPLSIVLAVDTSLSTRKDLPLELASARRFAHTILRPVDALSLYQFSEVVDEVVGFTPDLKKIDRAIDQIRLGAATALYDALYLGSRAHRTEPLPPPNESDRLRSEEHTSELQSHSDLVCRLLLEQKNRNPQWWRVRSSAGRQSCRTHRHRHGARPGGRPAPARSPHLGRRRRPRRTAMGTTRATCA